jgi:outer membrane protein assembly factor BamD
MTVRCVLLAGVLMLMGCGAGGRSRAHPPPETDAMLRARSDSLYRVGRQHFRNGRWERAIEALDRSLLGFEYTDPRRLSAHFMLGESHLGQGNQLLAVREFRRVADEAPSDTVAAEALFRAGAAYSELWRKPQLDARYGESALMVYRELTTRYPGTPAARRATGRIHELQEMFAEKEYRTALFYYRLKAYDSAILSLRHLIAMYPRTMVVSDALVKLLEAYRAVNYAEDVRDTCDYIAEFFPQTLPRVARLCPAGTAGGL